MKFSSVLLAIACLFTCAAAHAQDFAKGSTLLGGGFSIVSNTNDASGQNKQKFSGATLALTVGTAIRDNVFSGMYVEYAPSSYTVNNATNVQTQTRRGFGTGVFIRLYKDLGKGFHFFGQPALGYRFGKLTYSEVPGAITTDRTNEMALGLTPGFSYKVLKNLFLELSLRDVVSVNYKEETRNKLPKTKGFSLQSSTAAGDLSAVGIGFNLVF